ncbi:MAG: hypothetical protein KAT69_03225 [Candidatus Aminicenantes bacterium]|nr:hypothetical protein [Candidatus Aminicenantes bacterium]
MDVSKFQIKGEWLELEVKSKKLIGSLKFLVKPLSSSEQLDMADIGRESRTEFLDKIQDLVIDWNLTKNEQKLECNDENKKSFLPYLIPMTLKEEEKEEEKEITADEDLDKPKPKKIPGTVGLAILGFAQDFTNFIKN